MRRRSRFLIILVAVLLLLHGLPWLVVVWRPNWPTVWTVVGSAALAVGAVGLPLAMWRGHRGTPGPHSDGVAIAGDTWLGLIWILFSWSVIAGLVDIATLGAPQPITGRLVAAATLVWWLGLALWGSRQARKVPRVRPVEVRLDRLPSAFDGFRIVMITDTHFGPINRARWSARVAGVVNSLEPDVLVHAGDMADGSVDQRRLQAAPLATTRARFHRLYITGNHEYFSGAAEWTAHLRSLGWTVLRNKHVIVEKDGATLVFAGVDDRTARASGTAGHGADLDAALTGVAETSAVVLLAHQPHEVIHAVQRGVDLQLSGHTHGGQIWPFHLIVRVEQKALQGLSRAGGRTQLYTSRGSGFWGPPFRVFAPSEITVLTLRSGAPAG